MVPDSNHLPTELSMNADDKLLLQKLDAFTIGKKDVALDFKARLARENGWDQVFAARVIHEYKRFVFMAVR
jgi:hypothetical protein